MKKINSILCLSAFLLSAGNPVHAQSQSQSRWGADASRQLAMVVPVLDVSALKQSALMDFSSGQFSIAADKLKRVIGTGSAGPDDYYRLGEAQFHMGQFEMAAESFDHGTSMEECRVRQVEAYIAANQREKALKACTANLALPSSSFTNTRLQALQRILSRSAPKAPARKGAAAKFVEK